MNKTVSIIMPTYNAGRYIVESIKSVQKQTYSEWELIIIDDCSNDDTVKFIRAINDDRIVLIQNEKNEGAAISRNKGLKRAQGRWIAFLDSDDLWEKEKIEKQVKFMEKNDYKFTYTRYLKMNERNIIYREVTGPKVITNKLMNLYCWPGCLTVMIDRQLRDDLYIKAIKKNNDYAMWLKVIKKENCYLLDESLAVYREHEGSISNCSYFVLCKWHYIVFRMCSEKSILSSFGHMICNILFGIIKKIVYEKEVKDDD